MYSRNDNKAENMGLAVGHMAVKYRRVLLKLSGEALSGDKGFGLDVDTIQKICGGSQKPHE